MKKWLITLLLVASCADAAFAQIPGFTAAEVQTLGDLNFRAREKMGHSGPYQARLLALAYAMKNINGATVLSWKPTDPDPGQLLGFMADTPDGVYAPNRVILDKLAAYLQVPVKAVIWPPVAPTPPPAPSPAPAPAPAPAPPPATTAGTIEAAVQAVIDAKLAGLQAQVSGLATRLAALEARPAAGGTTVSGSSVTDQGNGELLFVGKDNGGTRQDNIRGDFKATMGVNNFDAGFRLHMNWGCVVPQLPYWTIGADSHGGFSYSGAPCPAGTWTADQTYGQALLIDGGWSQLGYDYATGAPYKPSILVASQRGGMDILMAVTPVRRAGIPGVRNGDPATNRVLFRARSDGSADPIDIVLNGQIRTLRACNIGGQPVVCF